MDVFSDFVGCISVGDWYCIALGVGVVDCEGIGLGLESWIGIALHRVGFGVLDWDCIGLGLEFWMDGEIPTLVWIVSIQCNGFFYTLLLIAAVTAMTAHSLEMRFLPS